jgi:hypothetical protein
MADPLVRRLGESPPHMHTHTHTHTHTHARVPRSRTTEQWRRTGLAWGRGWGRGQGAMQARGGSTRAGGLECRPSPSSMCGATATATAAWAWRKGHEATPQMCLCMSRHTCVRRCCRSRRFSHTLPSESSSTHSPHHTFLSSSPSSAFWLCVLFVGCGCGGVHMVLMHLSLSLSPQMNFSEPQPAQLRPRAPSGSVESEEAGEAVEEEETPEETQQPQASSAASSASSARMWSADVPLEPLSPLSPRDGAALRERARQAAEGRRRNLSASSEM